MRHAVWGLVAVVCLVVTAGVVVGLASGETTDSSSGLEAPPGEPTAVGAHAVTGDLSSVVSATDTTLRVDYDRVLLELAVEQVDDHEEVDEVVERFLDDLEAEARSFDDRTGEAVALPRGASLEGATLVNELLNQQHLATTRLAMLDDLEELIGHHPDTQRVAELYQLSTSPAREALLEARLDATTARVATMEVTNSSLKLATLADGTYHREMRRLDLRSDGDRDTVESLNEAESMVIDAYPDTTATRALSRFADNVYVVERTAQWGGVDAFVDGTFEAVFLERHRQWLAETTFERSTSRSVNELEITVQRTYASGPMQVSVTDEEGDPVSAAVYLRVDGRWIPLGSTDHSGMLWAVEPPDDFDIRVVTSTRTATLSIETG